MLQFIRLFALQTQVETQDKRILGETTSACLKLTNALEDDMTSSIENKTAPSPAIHWKNATDSLVKRLRHPAVYCFASVWGAAALYLLAAGHAVNVVFGLILLLGISVFMMITRRITPDPSEEVEMRPSMWRLGAQFSLILTVIGLTGYGSLRWLGDGELGWIPMWSPLMQSIGSWGSRFLTVEMVGDPVLSVVNPVRYALIPLVGLLLLGVAPRYLGIRAGQSTWWVVLLWCGIGLVLWAVQLFSGQITLNTIRRVLTANLLQNGFAEEFLFRGALQTRLNLVLATPWVVVIQALIFAVWHLGAGARLMDSDILLGVAANIVAIGPYGLAYGYIFHRTRNLMACSLIHAGLNSMF